MIDRILPHLPRTAERASKTTGHSPHLPGRYWPVAHDPAGDLQGADYKVSDIERTSYDTEECYLEDPDGYELWVSAPVQGE